MKINPFSPSKLRDISFAAENIVRLGRMTRLAKESRDDAAKRDLDLQFLEAGEHLLGVINSIFPQPHSSGLGGLAAGGSERIDRAAIRRDSSERGTECGSARGGYEAATRLRF